MNGRLFGTDGMRGLAFEPPLDRGTVMRLGSVLAAHLTAAGRPARVLLAGDTRISTPHLASWLGGAFAAAGGEVEWVGVLPTPAVSHLVRSLRGYGAGVVVSASHNPAPDNGIKLVGPEGMKWPVAEEMVLEARLEARPEVPACEPMSAPSRNMDAEYLEVLRRTLEPDCLTGLRVVVDAANGAGSTLAARLLGELGAVVTEIHGEPDGVNINDGCGALHPEELAAEVVRRGADAGVALDGDADRAVLVDAGGRVLDGDNVLLAWGRHLAAAGSLPGRTIVATVMSNLGLSVALDRDGIRVVQCPVGDREVWESMGREGAVLGGEQSGHVICSHHAVTGDGLLTAAHLLAIARRSGRALGALAELERFPQVLLNVPVGVRRPLEEIPSVVEAIRHAEAELGRTGRVFVRYSGTEPLLRVMVEAASVTTARSTAEHLAALAHEALAAPPGS
ncbi:MAG: phosphoglucosamine mutase [Acidobacteriota bacterium]